MTINYKNTSREMEKSLKNHPQIIVDTIIIIIITFLMQNSGVAELCMKSKVPSGKVAVFPMLGVDQDIGGDQGQLLEIPYESSAAKMPPPSI